MDHAFLELLVRKMGDQLRENEPADVHPSLWKSVAEGVPDQFSAVRSSNRFRPKFPLRRWIEMVYRFSKSTLPDTSVLDSITADKVAGYVTTRIEAGRQVTTINRELEVLRRMLKLAVEWGKVEKLLPSLNFHAKA
jgi:hypothetical protein